MTAPEQRRPLPALAFIAALCVLTALVWFRVIHRSDGAATAACPTASPSSTAPAALTELPTPSRVAVLVLNSTQRKGLAAGAGKVLKSDGFTVTNALDDSTTYGGTGSIVPGVAEIRYAAAQVASATLLKYYFPSATLRVFPGAGTTINVALGAKFRAVASTATVKAELAKAKLTLSNTVAPVPSPTATSTCTSTSSPTGTGSSTASSTGTSPAASPSTGG